MFNRKNIFFHGWFSIVMYQLRPCGYARWIRRVKTLMFSTTTRHGGPQLAKSVSLQGWI